MRSIVIYKCLLIIHIEETYLFYFDCILINVVDVNHAQNRWNQPVLNYEDYIACSRNTENLWWYLNSCQTRLPTAPDCMPSNST